MIKALSEKLKANICSIVLITGLFFGISSTACAETISSPTCGGDFVNPITDICWDCMFPLRIMGVELVKGKQPDQGSKGVVCSCGDPIPRIGIPLEFWEPARLIDITKKPYCFPNMGGLTIDPGISAPSGKNGNRTSGRQSSFWQVHYYIYPVLNWLELIANYACLENGGFDVGYITELDPTWNDDQLTFILNPEAVLFANPVTQAAGAIDCIASSTGSLPIDSIFWMAGCQGSMYPMNGRVSNENSSLQSALLVAEKMVFKLHRQGIAWGYKDGLCGKYPMPVMAKSQYRTQLVNPVPTVGGAFGCSPVGRSSILYESLKSYPVNGEDFGILLWRKRSCCAL